MAGYDHTTGVVYDRFFERTERVYVEVVGRFVKQKHIGTASQELGQMNAISFTTGQYANFLLLIALSEIKSRKPER